MTLLKFCDLLYASPKNRKPQIRTMCGPVWASDLENLSLDVNAKKLHFFLLHQLVSL